MPTRKELIASGAEVTPLTREEYFLKGEDVAPLNVKERVLQGVVGGGIEPEGTITITQNGTGIDVAQYATADVVVPIGSNTGSLKVTRTDSITKNIVVAALTAESSVNATTTLIGKSSNKTVRVATTGTFWLVITVDIIGSPSRTMTVSGNTGGDVIYYKADAAYYAFVPIACPVDTEISVAVSNG